MSVASRGGRARASRKPRAVRLLVPILTLLILGASGLAFVGYVLWPRWPNDNGSPDLPALPVTVADVVFNVPPAAVRVAVQRKPGAHERLDLAYLWPTLAPPDAGAAPVHAGAEAPIEALKPAERLFVTIAAADGLSPEARRESIYPRYLAETRTVGADGLAVAPFRAGTPYQGEDLVYPSETPEQFAWRCTRPGPGDLPGSCLSERRIGNAEITVRFSRALIGQDWSAVADGIERLIASLHARA